MNILLVEDQTNYAFIVREMLHKEAVVTVASVERLDQALDHLAQQTPELILLDICCPTRAGSILSSGCASLAARFRSSS